MGIVLCSRQLPLLGWWVGASEILVYYWCTEKGYGAYTGKKDDSQDWLKRAKGWIKVMKWDAWGSMLVYTFCTIAFYLLKEASTWTDWTCPIWLRKDPNPFLYV